MTTVFTNGCFDLPHPGHVYLLERAKSLGDKLIVAVNRDESVERIKGRKPFVDIGNRVSMLKALRCVDVVTVFDTEEQLDGQIMAYRPDVLVKGSDARHGKITGEERVLGYGGRVLLLERLPEYSTTAIIERIQVSNYKPRSKKR